MSTEVAWIYGDDRSLWRDDNNRNLIPYKSVYYWRQRLQKCLWPERQLNYLFSIKDGQIHCYTIWQLARYLILTVCKKIVCYESFVEVIFED